MLKLVLVPTLASWMTKKRSPAGVGSNVLRAKGPARSCASAGNDDSRQQPRPADRIAVREERDIRRRPPSTRAARETAACRLPSSDVHWPTAFRRGPHIKGRPDA